MSLRAIAMRPAHFDVPVRREHGAAKCPTGAQCPGHVASPWIMRGTTTEDICSVTKCRQPPLSRIWVSQKSPDFGERPSG
jgi:hypothetical protein